jgi:acyl carrier protein
MELKDKIVKLISETTKLDPAKIQPNSSFIDDLNLDSLDMVELMMKMEDEFGLEIPEKETEKLKTVNDVIQYIQIKKNS